MRHPRKLPQRLIDAVLRDIAKVLNVLEPIMENDVFDQEDISSYTTHVHAMKSALANVGEAEISNSAHVLEEAARDKNIELIREKTQDFIESLKMFAASLKDDEEPEAVNEDKAFLREQLMVIYKACEIYDIQSAKVAINKLREKSFTSKTKSIVGQISGYLLNGDFESAGQLIKRQLDF